MNFLKVTNPLYTIDILGTPWIFVFRSFCKPKKLLCNVFQDSDALSRMQQVLLNLQAELERVNGACNQVMNDTENNTKSIDELFNLARTLEEVKADKDYVQSEVNVVSNGSFESYCVLVERLWEVRTTQINWKSSVYFYLIQECIPVGCVPPAHWPYLVISYAPPLATTHTPRNHACPPATTHAPNNHAHTPATMHTPLQPHTPPLQPHMPPATMHAPSASMHAPPQPHMPPGNHACPPATTHAPQQPCMLPLQPCIPPQPCMPPTTTHTPSNHACPSPSNHAPPPWTEFLTHASENITLPQTSFAGGKNILLQ